MKPHNYLLMLTIIAIGNCSDEINVAELLTNGNNKFTANLFLEAAKNNVGKSFVLSPFAVLTPLAQLSLASEGKSHDELLRTLGSPNDESTKSIFTYMNNFFTSIKGIDLKMASKIYVAKGYTLNENYAAVSREIFQSEFASIDFAKNKEASEEINAWRYKKCYRYLEIQKILLEKCFLLEGLKKKPTRRFSSIKTLSRHINMLQEYPLIRKITKDQRKRRKSPADLIL